MRWLFSAFAAIVLLPGCHTYNNSLTLASQLRNMNNRQEACEDRGLAACPNVAALAAQFLAKPSADAGDIVTTAISGKSQVFCKDFAASRSNESTVVYPTTGGSLKDLQQRHNHTYLIVAVPPHWGSTGLEGLISSSPHVSDMCAAGTWACEGTWLLSRAHLFDGKTRWLPNFTNWEKAFEIFHAHAWNMSKHFLMDKSPPNVAKMAELVDFFESHDMNYFFITMGRHPCLFDVAKHQHYKLKADLLRENMVSVPKERHIHLLYEEAMLDPKRASQLIIDRIPELEQLDYGLNGMSEALEERKRERSKHQSKKPKKDKKKKNRTGKDGRSKRGDAHIVPRPAAAASDATASDATALRSGNNPPVTHRLRPNMTLRTRTQIMALAKKKAMENELRAKLHPAEQRSSERSATSTSGGDVGEGGGVGPARRSLGRRSESWLEYAQSKSCFLTQHSACYDPQLARDIGYPPPPPTTETSR